MVQTARETASPTTPEAGVSPSLLGMILFVTSEVMFFGGLFALFLTLRSSAAEWPPAGAEPELALPLLGTLILLGSSATVHTARAALESGRTRRASARLLVTAALGLAFLAIQALEYARAGFALGDHSYGTAFFTLTGFHALHVALGVGMLLVAALQIRRGSTTPERTGQVEATALYWHFVDAIWVLVLVIVYLIDA